MCYYTYQTSSGPTAHSLMMQQIRFLTKAWLSLRFLALSSICEGVGPDTSSSTSYQGHPYLFSPLYLRVSKQRPLCVLLVGLLPHPPRGVDQRHHRRQEQSPHGDRQLDHYHQPSSSFKQSLNRFSSFPSPPCSSRQYPQGCKKESLSNNHHNFHFPARGWSLPSAP